MRLPASLSPAISPRQLQKSLLPVIFKTICIDHVSLHYKLLPPLSWSSILQFCGLQRINNISYLNELGKRQEFLLQWNLIFALWFLLIWTLPRSDAFLVDHRMARGFQFEKFYRKSTNNLHYVFIYLFFWQSEGSVPENQFGWLSKPLHLSRFSLFATQGTYSEEK